MGKLNGKKLREDRPPDRQAAESARAPVLDGRFASMVPKPLPVPDLQETVQRTLHAASALLDEPQMQRCEAQAREFVEGEGPRLQERLIAFAAAQGREGASYLSREWQDSYLKTRTPLPLTTSVSFQLSGFALEPGINRVADFLHRAAAIHLLELRGQTPQEIDPRGTALDMDQWGVLAPGIRHPMTDRDQIRRPKVDPAAARIGLLFGGRLFTTPITDDAAALLPPATLAKALAHLCDRTRSERTELSTAPADDLSFVDLSYLGSEIAAPLLEELLSTRENAETYEQLSRLLFVVDILPAASGTPTLSESDRLRSLAFEPGHSWAYKPVSYQIDLASPWLGIHFEHSAADGATIRAAVQRMRELDVDGPEAPGAEHTPEVAELRWEMSAELRNRIEDHMARYRERSAQLRVDSVTVDRPDLQALGIKISDDAVQQLLLTYAQLATFGKVRAAYESVDMREYQAGRTECLRPVTPEAVEFAQALVNQRATLDQCAAAMEAHRDWVKACKAGAGIDRHLTGLELMVNPGEAVPDFLVGEGRATVTENFLSTTSLGVAEPISRYAFAPASQDGLGIGYIKYPDHYEYVINSHAHLAPVVAEFSQKIDQAARVLQQWVQQQL
ncbi:choline/carnitine O-acyltransferase [Kocuria sp.]|uniref:choline/carnitine O-acyltransferase n=1 Tax=Kocuria sp. TaxID=1871328 RepID=UPI0026DF54AF|nr:choline/carnitine O-acyltransferase [Kocuria sp.]MDO5619411.1 choline/carnitine O-acyltransferase [Kocuria sp.]